MRRIGLVLLLATMLAPILLAPAARAESVVWFEASRALSESQPGRRARAYLRRRFEIRQHELDRRQAELRALRDRIEAGDHSAESRRIYEERYRQLEVDYEHYRAQLAEVERTIVERLLVCADRVADGIRSDRGATSASRSESRPAGADDVTASVIAGMDADGCAGERRDG